MDICADEQQFYLFRRPDELTEKLRRIKNTRISIRNNNKKITN